MVLLSSSDDGGITIVSRNSLEDHFGISHLDVGAMMQNNGIVIFNYHKLALVISYSGPVLVLVIAQNGLKVTISFAAHSDCDVLTARVTVISIKLDVRFARFGITSNPVNSD